MDSHLVVIILLLSLQTLNGVEMMRSEKAEPLGSQFDEGSGQGSMLFYSGMGEFSLIPDPSQNSTQENSGIGEFSLIPDPSQNSTQENSGIGEFSLIPDPSQNSTQENSGMGEFSPISDSPKNSTQENSEETMPGDSADIGTSSNNTLLNSKIANVTSHDNRSAVSTLLNNTGIVNATGEDTGSGDVDADIGDIIPPNLNRTTQAANPKFFTTLFGATSSNSSTFAVPSEAIGDRNAPIGSHLSGTDGLPGTGTMTKNSNGMAWAAITGTALTVAFLSLIIFLLLKKRSHRDFLHRKLVEDIAGQPVLRLDNSEPLGMNNMTYSNSGFQSDTIQMNRIHYGGPQRQY